MISLVFLYLVLFFPEFQITKVSTREVERTADFVFPFSRISPRQFYLNFSCIFLLGQNYCRMRRYSQTGVKNKAINRQTLTLNIDISGPREPVIKYATQIGLVFRVLTLSYQKLKPLFTTGQE